MQDEVFICFWGKYNCLKTSCSFTIILLPKGIITTRIVDCKFGYYGVQCQHECSTFCKESRKCDHVSGFCEGGCSDGWHGHFCLDCKLFDFTSNIFWLYIFFIFNIYSLITVTNWMGVKPPQRPNVLVLTWGARGSMDLDILNAYN